MQAGTPSQIRGSSRCRGTELRHLTGIPAYSSAPRRSAASISAHDGARQTCSTPSWLIVASRFPSGENCVCFYLLVGYLLVGRTTANARVKESYVESKPCEGHMGHFCKGKNLP